MLAVGFKDQQEKAKGFEDRIPSLCVNSHKCIAALHTSNSFEKPRVARHTTVNHFDNQQHRAPSPALHLGDHFQNGLGLRLVVRRFQQVGPGVWGAPQTCQRVCCPLVFAVAAEVANRSKGQGFQ